MPPKSLSIFAFAIVAAIAISAFVHYKREYRQRTMLKAAWDGDVATVRHTVAAGAKIEGTPNGDAGGGEPALIAAAWGGHSNVIEFLLNHGAEIDRKDGAGNTALNAAVKRGHLSTVQLLLSRGADPNIGGEDSPLRNANSLGNAALIELLNSHGATE